MSSKSQPFIARKPTPPLAFGPFTLDMMRGVLLHGSDEVKLRPQSYEALKYLVTNSGRLVPKSELFAVLWPNTASVSDDSLTQCIRDVRRALSGDGKEYVRNLPGRGYMFIVPVEFRPAAEFPEAGPAAPDTPLPSFALSRRPKWTIAGCVVAVLGLAASAWAWKARADHDWAVASVSRVKQLAEEGRYSEGYELALKVLRRFPAELSVTRLMSELSDNLSVSTTPSGAEVFLRRLGSSEVQRVGVTPIRNFAIARGEFVISLRKAGYSTFERTASTAALRLGLRSKTPWDLTIDHHLQELSQAREGMAFVPGGAHRLRGYSRRSDASVSLGDYFIDKFEVSNRDFKAFLSSGGYNRSELWQAKGIAAHLTDKTGMPGPRGWIGGTFPDGKATHPVTAITWYEASAYCRAQGKDLPTLFQWERAARAEMHSAFSVMFPWGPLEPRQLPQRANFESQGTSPVDSFEFGMSPFGVYNMAGNVMEWVRNAYDNGFTTAGGAFSDPAYQFGHYGSRPALGSDETIGFRCAIAVPGAAGDEGNIPFTAANDTFEYRASTNAEFEVSRRHYDYDKTPLHASVTASVDADQWRREEIAFDGYGGERARAFLYLPRNAHPPYQLIHYMSGDAWWLGVPVTNAVEFNSQRMAPAIRGGRALLMVVLKGFDGREPVGAWAKRDYNSSAYRDILYQWSVDMRRALDYIESRTDIDTRKIAFWNDSTYDSGAIFAALENRYASVIFMGAGSARMFEHVPADANPLHFLPHIHQPKLVLHGLYDDGHPPSSAEPLFRLMREPKKRLTFAAGHIAPALMVVPPVHAFLDETLGPVRRK